MTECFWIRHAPIHPTGYYTGHTDVDAIIPTTPARLAYSLPEDTVWMASPLKRAVQTAQWLNPAAKPLHLAPELKEQCFGAWEGRYYDEVWKTAGQAYDWTRPEHIRPENGESFADVCARVDRWLGDMLKGNPPTPLIIITHAGVIRAALRQAHGIGVAQALSFPVDCGSVTHIRYGATGAHVICDNLPAWE